MNLLRRLGLCLAILSLACLAIGDPSSNVPQLCYTSDDQLAPSNLMPCFDSTIDNRGVYGCCLAGDHCLSNQACYNGYKGVTYQKGCTRKHYDHLNCPQKCETDQSKSDYVGLIFCNGTNGTPSDTWICHHPDNCLPASNCKADTHWSSELEVTKKTDCQDIIHNNSWVAFRGKSPLKSTASLPQGTDILKWYSDHSNFSTRWVRTGSKTSELEVTFATDTAGALQTTAPAGSTNGSQYTTSTFTSGESQSIFPSNSTAGIPLETSSLQIPNKKLIVGLAMGIPVVLACLGILGYFLRKRHTRGEQYNPASTEYHGDETNADGKSTGTAGEAYGHSTKAELPAEEKPAQVLEMEGSTVHSSSPTELQATVQGGFGKGDMGEHRDDIDLRVYELPG